MAVELKKDLRNDSSNFVAAAMLDVIEEIRDILEY